MMMPAAMSAVVPAPVWIRRALNPEFWAPLDFPAPRANPNVDMRMRKDYRQREGLHPIQDRTSTVRPRFSGRLIDRGLFRRAATAPSPETRPQRPRVRRCRPVWLPLLPASGLLVVPAPSSVIAAAPGGPSPLTVIPARREEYTVSELAHFGLCPYRYKLERLEPRTRRFTAGGRVIPQG
jgi:hypothetical protein